MPKPRQPGEILHGVACYLKPYKWMAAGTIGCALLPIAFSLVYPKLTQYVIDDVIRQKDAKRLTTIMLALLGAFAMRDLFNSLRILINNTLEQNVIYDMRRDVYARLQRLPVNYFDQRASIALMKCCMQHEQSAERRVRDESKIGCRAMLWIND
jgi:ATP-binding cassette subfamily B protein/subfamily B ATP-binding cassette protein MsbA